MTKPPEVEDLDPDDASEDESRRYLSLDRALEKRKMPAENRLLIRRFTSAIGITAYYERSVYIKALRADGHPALNIAYGWTNGFISEAEVEEAAGPSVERWRSQRGPSHWGITHPVHKAGGSGGGAKADERDYGTCPSCFMKLPATRHCSHCDG